MKLVYVFPIAPRLGLTSFGGPIAHIGYFRQSAWPAAAGLDDRSFRDLIALGQLLPGPRGRQGAGRDAPGVYISRDRAGPGSGLKGIVQAIDYLTASNRKGFGDSVPEFDSGELDAIGKRVVVIGGGDTAMDCVRTAVRQGAVSVKCLYRRDRENMPGSVREVMNAEEEGVEFVWLTAPKGFTGDATVTGVKAARMRLGLPDVTGRQTPEPAPGSDYTEPCELAIKALGFEPEEIVRRWDAEGLEVTRGGTVTADFRSHATSPPGL